MNLTNNNNKQAISSTLIEQNRNKKIRVIVNQKAGRGIAIPNVIRKIVKLQPKYIKKPETLLSQIKNELEHYGFAPDMVITQRANHATELAKEAAEKAYDIVVAVGGDGTINEVVNGLVFSDTTLGIIPTGTADLLATELNIPCDIEYACKIISTCDSRKIDTGIVNDRHFTIMASIGFDAYVISKVTTKLKSKWGALSYLITACKEASKYPFRRIRYKTEDGVEHKSFYVFIQNAKLYGSGFELTPESQLDDGLMELVVFNSKDIFRPLLYLISKDKEKHPKKVIRINNLDIFSKQAIQVDGDYAFKGPAKISICPLSLKVIINNTT
jgi:YegS/Rv2252/BmrU family lipid kinase